jgi:tRNA(fMet)-specific endonuclease VapC
MAMKIAIDTNRYRDFCSGEAVAVECLQTAERIFLPYVVLAELRAGFRCGSRGRENEQVLNRFVHRPRVEVLYASEATTQHYAQLFFQLRTQSTPIPTNDLWIAALVVEHNLALFSRDGHFDHLPQLARA